MINIDDDEFEDETLEERIYEKADLIGEILTGERKINLQLPKKSIPLLPPLKKEKKSSIQIFITDLKKSIDKYKKMSLSRILGLSIILMIAIFIISIIAFLILTLATNLLQLGLIGYIVFIVLMCLLCIFLVLLLTSRYR